MISKWFLDSDYFKFDFCWIYINLVDDSLVEFKIIKVEFKNFVIDINKLFE